MAQSTLHQPQLPPEQPPSRAEKFFIEVQPAIFPPNQDSNWGLKRKIWTDQVQALIAQQDSIWRERFVATSVDFIDEWEFQVGIPQAPATMTLEQRRQRVLARLRTGPFTDAIRIILIEPYIVATFGVSTEITPDGISLTGGIPLKADASGDPKQYYRIYEDVRNFTYTLFIRSDVTPDVTTLSRDMERVTPAGITYVLDNTKADILNYNFQVRNEQPIAYWHLDGTLANVSGYAGLNLTDPGSTASPATVASPGLLNSHTTGGVSNGARDFDGSNDYLTSPSLAAFTFPQVSMEALVTIDTLPGTSAYKIIFAPSLGFDFGIVSDASGNKSWSFRWKVNGGTQMTWTFPFTEAVGGPYHVVAAYDGHWAEFIVNGISKGRIYAPGTPDTPSTTGLIGNMPSTSWFWDGKIDEVAIYNDALTVDQARLHYNTSQNDWHF